MTDISVQKLEMIARVVHETNAAYRYAIGEARRPSWDELPLMARLDLMEAVRTAAMTELSPEQSHNRWVEVRKGQGWQYGEKENPTLREHPCMVEFDKLPHEQQAKDRLFLAVVKALR